MHRSAGLRTHRVLTTLLFAVVLGCGGGGGGGGSDDSASSTGSGGQTDFYLKTASIARAILDVDGQLDQLVNPASLFESDPLTGVPLVGFPKALNPGASLTALSQINLTQVQDPLTPQIPLVPRNAAIVLEFTKAIDATTLGLTAADDAAQPNEIQATSPVQIKRKDGQLVPTRAWIDGKRLVLLGVTPETLGFEPSPLVFDSQGKPVEEPKGFMRITLGVIGTLPLRATDGTVLGIRSDGLGGPGEPFPFNPGNAVLDAIVQQTDTSLVTFNGFLPDKSPPRIVRPVERSGAISGITTVSVGGQLAIRFEASDMLPAPNVLANAGSGEWANSRLVVSSAGGSESQYVVSRNLDVGGVPTFELAVGSVLDPAVAIDDTFVLTRTEFFEPVPPPLPSDPAQLARLTVDPVNVPRDPLDPEDLHNSDLRYFMRVYDEDGVERTNRWNPATGTFLAFPPKSSLEITFNEPMDVESFRPYESFYVKAGESSATDPAFTDMRLGDVVASDQGRRIRFRPFLLDQVDPEASSFVGFGGTASALRLVLRTLPEGEDISALQSSATPDVIAQLEDLPTLGIDGLTDLGGRGLGLPAALLDQGDVENFILASTSAGLSPFPPAVDFSIPFETQPTSDPDYRVVVHRFLGQAQTASISYDPETIHDEVTSGVEYGDYPAVDEDDDGEVDRRFIYGPQLVEVGLNIPGRLTGAPANTIEHLIDNYNPPKPSNFASPNGEDFLISVGFGLGVPINSPFGARFQHVYRAGDASPAVADYQDIVLDLVGLAWSPFLPLVNTQLDRMSIVVGLSGANKGRGPNTNQNNGIPEDTGSGLQRQFDCNFLDWHANCFCTANDSILPSLAPYVDEQPSATTVVKRDTPYPILNANLFKPASAGTSSSFNFFLDFPKFNSGFDPYFESDKVFSFPYTSRFPMLIEYRIGENDALPARNVFRFSPGILTSVLPRFRVWSQGQDPLAHCVPNFNVAGGNPPTPAGGEGGPLIEPGSFTQPIQPPLLNNGMPTLQVKPYILPPRGDNCAPNQPVPDAEDGTVDANIFCIKKFPKCNTFPESNFYFANGMLAYPLPNTIAYPGPIGQPPTYWYGYGVPAAFQSPTPSLDNNPCVLPFNLGNSNLPNVVSNEPGMQGPPGNFGDNSRYYMLWKYKKRVSIVQSPTIEIDTPSGAVRYLRPIVEPPLSEVETGASLKVEVKAGTLLDFSVPQLDSGYVDVLSETFSEDVTGVGEDRVYVKFRATFGVAATSTQPPSIDTIIIPYEKVKP